MENRIINHLLFPIVSSKAFETFYSCVAWSFSSTFAQKSFYMKHQNKPTHIKLVNTIKIRSQQMNQNESYLASNDDVPARSNNLLAL